MRMTCASGVLSVRRGLAALAMGLALAAGAHAAPADEIQTVLPKDAIPAIDNPEYVGVNAAEKFMKADELVIGIDIGGQRRAYSVPLLSSHEIVNDVVGGRKIAISW